MMKMTLSALTGTAMAGAAMMAMIATSVSAQDITVQNDPIAQALRERGEAYRRGADEKQDQQELRTTSALNAEILEQNDLAEMQDRANQSAFSKAQADYQDQLDLQAMETRRIEADAAAKQAAYQAEVAAYERAQADWSACVAGDKSRCTQPPQ